MIVYIKTRTRIDEEIKPHEQTLKLKKKKCSKTTCIAKGTKKQTNPKPPNFNDPSTSSRSFWKDSEDMTEVVGTGRC